MPLKIRQEILFNIYMVRTFKKPLLFKKCSKCGNEWKSRSLFLADPEVKLIGYQANYRELTEGLFLFNHSCETTISIKAQLFIDLYDGPIFQDKLTDSKECYGYCSARDNLMQCTNKCECAYVRETVHIVNTWQKNGKPA